MKAIKKLSKEYFLEEFEVQLVHKLIDNFKSFDLTDEYIDEYLEEVFPEDEAIYLVDIYRELQGELSVDDIDDLIERVTVDTLGLFQDYCFANITNSIRWKSNKILKRFYSKQKQYIEDFGLDNEVINIGTSTIKLTSKSYSCYCFSIRTPIIYKTYDDCLKLREQYINHLKEISDEKQKTTETINENITLWDKMTYRERTKLIEILSKEIFINGDMIKFIDTNSEKLKWVQLFGCREYLKGFVRVLMEYGYVPEDLSGAELRSICLNTFVLGGSGSIDKKLFQNIKKNCSVDDYHSKCFINIIASIRN
ncbi:hypothetical protein [Maribellus mangrovi]|uniref:hypothetical protein n=1 Tax=Maribellus mangrovi TaxID=3133146 RepID=UPI0030ECA0A9